MKSIIRTCIFTTAFTTIACFGLSNNAEAGNSWRWSKPLNQKAGSLFYSSNRKSHRKTYSRSSTSHRFYQPRSYAKPIAAPHTSYPHITVRPHAVIAQPTPKTIVHPIRTGQVIHAPAPAPSRAPVATPVPVSPPTQTPSVLNGWLVP